MKLFDKKSDIEIVLQENSDEAIRLAAADLQDNLRRLSGQMNGFAIVEKSTALRAVRIQTQANGEIEAYTVRIDDENVLITGSDTLGTVFGIYAFATKCLGILPVYRLVDLFPETREEMEIGEQSFSSEKRAIRFRGWFLNDEDLLTDFRGGAGERHINYHYYQSVMRPDVLDVILETALRMEINLVIPSSFVDVDNPPEEKLAEAVVRRGMYITQHHVEPMGVSYFAVENYLKKRGIEGEDVSFVGNRARMEEIWRYYAEKWAQYGDRVIWQLGLRGKADRAVWQDDPSVPNSAASRGAIISDAIATQHRIVCETLGHSDFYATATLWMEGAELYGKGYLQFPENTVVVFSDIGHSQMFGDDFFTTRRNERDRYGIYYHIAYMTEGPHLAEGCDLGKMAFSYQKAWEQDSLFYSILNVSNVRPLHFSAWYNSELLKNPNAFDTDKTLDKLLVALFGTASKEIKPLAEEYYAAIADLGEAELKVRCNKYNFYYHDYGKLPFPLFSATDGALRYTGRACLDGVHYTADDGRFAETVQNSLPKWEALYKRMQETEPALPAACRLYFCQYLKFQTFYMMQLTRWRLAVRTMMQTEDPTERDAAFEEASASLRSILEERKILELGEWKGWHDGDVKIGIPNLLKQTEERYTGKSKGAL